MTVDIMAVYKTSYYHYQNLAISESFQFKYLRFPFSEKTRKNWKKNSFILNFFLKTGSAKDKKKLEIIVFTDCCCLAEWGSIKTKKKFLCVVDATFGVNLAPRHPV